MMRVAAICLGAIGLVVSCSGPSHAQAFGPSGSGSMSGGSSGVGSSFTGSPSYVPFSGATGGFVPYTPGPGGGLGVQPGMRGAGRPTPTGGMGSMLGARPGLGAIRGALTPPAPIGAGATGGGMGSMGGLIRRSPSGGAMQRMARPPVGGYPFRQPPSLLGPGASAPSMSM